MRTAIVHDWIYVVGGAEKVLHELINIFPDADVFSAIDFLPDRDRGIIHHKKVKTSVVQRFPFASTKHRLYASVIPLAMEQLDLRGYDLVLSSSSAFAKGVITGPDQLHICYMHSPMRWAWDMQQEYLIEAGLDKGILSWLARIQLYFLRNWDVRSTNGVDHIIANSDFIRRRIEKVYRRNATVIFPPVDCTAFTMRDNKEDFYLTASRMVPYKKIPLIVEAFSAMPDKRLVVIGDGPEMGRVKGLAGPNVEILGYMPFEGLRDHMQRARAFVFAAEEDFGIVPVEAQACGTPVIAFGKGGALETVRSLGVSRPTGTFFLEQTTRAIVDAVNSFERQQHEIQPIHCVENAARFSAERFRREILSTVGSHLHAHRLGAGSATA